ncbi:hypothetical protein [Amorphus sp. 3PC139-8]|uniref:hypothetical protein n=1 Tax=Amorphus sp. 3PC139-8 TaxID=2735676 RepID=UPI00345DF4F5
MVDEIDYLPGRYLHEVMKRRKLMRKHKDRLLLSPAGRDALDRPGLVQAELFPETFRGRYLPSLDAASMGDFDLYFGLLEPAATDSRRFDADGYRYRPPPLFDRFVDFHVAADGGSDATH